MEEFSLDEDGRVNTLSLSEYKLPTMKDIVPFRSVCLRGKNGHRPYGAKMIGEMSNIGVAPAIANAIFDAVGIRITQLPITAERVFNALHPSMV